MATATKNQSQATRRNPATVCPVNGCQCAKQVRHIFCTKHWYAISLRDRDRLAELQRTEPGSDDHQMAVQAAIEEIEGKEGFAQD